MELVRFPSSGGFSVRSIISFVLAVVSAVLLWVVLSATPAQAATTATWSGTETILFDNHGYTQDDELKDTTGTIPAGSTIYTAQVQTDSSTKDQEMLVLYFAPGVDPPTATTVKYVAFDYKAGAVSNPHDQQDVELTPQGEETPVSSCSVTGIGWLVCPISVFLANGVDWLFDQIASFMEVRPLMLGDTDNGIYVAWNIARSIANLAFVIVFLIIIYSQLTTLGVNNYGLKKLIPRLVIAAILVNVSFYIAALAIDISNVLGYSINDAFVAIREQIFHVTNDDLSGINTDGLWASIAAVALGAGGVIGGIYFVDSGAYFLLLPLLLGLILTVMFVFILLAARQALIILLVIVAPLAFVAYLLPNTEKWFDKWKDLFMTMLIFFPAFAAVFGASQLAGQIIIQNAGDNFVMLIFGAAVQIAPLVLTPLLLRLSGTVLGRIAQIANNPRKGLIDRNKNWAAQRAELKRNTNIGKDLSNSSKWNPTTYGSRMLKASEFRKKRLEGKLAASKDNAEAEYLKHRKYSDVHENADLAKMNKEHAEHVATTHAHDRMNRTGTRLNTAMLNLEESKTAAERSTQGTETLRAEFRAGKFDVDAAAPNLTIEQRDRMRAVQTAMARNVMETTALKRAAEGATIVQQFDYAQEINSSTPQVFENGRTLREMAAGIDPNGAQRAQASATAVIQEVRTKTIDNMTKIIRSKNPTPAEILELAKGNSVRGIEPTQDAIAAALQMTFGGGDTSQIVAGLEGIDLSFTGAQYAGLNLTNDQREELQVLASTALMSNAAKPPFATFGILGKMGQGKDFAGQTITSAFGEQGLNDMILNVVKAGKIDKSKLQSAGKDYSEAMLRAMTANPNEVSIEERTRLLQNLNIALDPGRDGFEKLGDSFTALDELRTLLRTNTPELPTSTPPAAPPPTTPTP